MNVIAFYLPQFHRIPENDAWWGEGFTEWTNIKKAKPLFDGHYQPRIPLNGNYYNLLDPKTLRWQVDLANKYGVGGFCFYHYWFDGHMLLQKPVEMFLEDKSLDLPFCICWANEHWTNQWVSGENKVLIEQRYGSQDEWEEHFEYLLPFLRDERYIRVDGKPLVVLYRPEIIDCLDEMLACWRELAEKAGLGGLTIVYQHPSYFVYPGKNESLFDYNIEFQPTMALTLEKSKHHKVLRAIKRRVALAAEKHLDLDLRFVGNSSDLTHISYDDVWNTILSMEPTRDTSFPGAFVDWDNTPRRGERGTVYDGVTVDKFKGYFKRQVERARQLYESDYLFIFAWNEWAEGGYLEPDEKRQYGFLEAIHDSLEELDELPSREK
jgi:hypothetical protein